VTDALHELKGSLIANDNWTDIAQAYRYHTLKEKHKEMILMVCGGSVFMRARRPRSFERLPTTPCAARLPSRGEAFPASGHPARGP
jgi:hypothetical protein